MSRAAGPHPLAVRAVTLDTLVRDAAERVLGSSITQAASVGGGSIARAYWCVLENRREVFVKTAADAPPDMFECEAESLARMAETRTVRVPRVLGSGAGWLLLEWLEPGGESRSGWKQLGVQLARMHRVQGDSFGWNRDNYIGPLPQPNAALRAWPAFWRERRLSPQLERARSQLDARTLDRLDALLDTLDERLGPAGDEGPSLLHGDLWSGNVQFGADGAALFDPACSYGHREVDLAMAALFGGFPAEFFSAYDAEWPLRAGAVQRRPIYQLYYLLVHVNLFGGAYIEQTRSLLERIG
jgi:protein-ribulosamine 3-kinase